MAFVFQPAADGTRTARDGRFPCRRLADTALRRVPGVDPPGGLPSFTPARRALDPMAIACFVDRAPCLPSRM
jgi:hypothetical protein